MRLPSFRLLISLKAKARLRYCFGFIFPIAMAMNLGWKFIYGSEIDLKVYGECIFFGDLSRNIEPPETKLSPLLPSFSITIDGTRVNIYFLIPEIERF